jgi:4-amino-4-deoxy-L-arabinose transferase-like glycosyltransferase
MMVLGFALVLRVWGIDFGLPYDLTYDEVHEIVRAFKLGAGEYDWRGFSKGGLYYLLFVEYGLLYVVWWLTGRIADAHDFALLYFQEPSVFYLAGRLTVALMGVVTCLVIFLLGRRAYDWRVGLGTAAIGATAYYHGAWSHYINVDIGLTLALWASIWAYLQYEHNQQLRWLIGAGALGGIAIAFKLPGAIVLFLLLVAIASRPAGWRFPWQRLKEAGLVVLTLLVTLTVVAPEWVMRLDSLHTNFSNIFGQAPSRYDAQEGPLLEAIDAVTIYGGKEWATYFVILLKPYNVVLTLSALLGMVLGLWRRHRWDMIWSLFIVVFLGIMSVADRTGSDRYLLPIMPGLWLLSSRAIISVVGHRPWVAAVGFACVIIASLVALVRQDYMWTKPDTRELAKVWIEENVPSGAKILMDGMRFRFVQSPPLQPDPSTVARRVTQASEAERLSRGVSQRTLALYAEAMAQVTGPTYALHSTVWGLQVEDPAHYVQACFDYIITSSDISQRYAHGSARQRFPKSARFYDQLPTDPRFRVVYAVGPVPWHSRGPAITVYKVLPTCEGSPNDTDNVRVR